MSTSLNCDGNDKILKSESVLFYNTVSALNLNFKYEDMKNPDYDCLYLEHKDIVEMINSGRIPEDTELYRQITNVIEAGDDLRLVH